MQICWNEEKFLQFRKRFNFYRINQRHHGGRDVMRKAQFITTRMNLNCVAGARFFQGRRKKSRPVIR